MLITASGAFVILFLLDPLLTLTIPALIPVFFIGMKLLGRRLRVLGRKARKAEADIVWLASSDLDMLPAIKTFAVEDEQRRRYDEAVEKARILKLRQTRITAFIQPVIALVAAGAAIAILLLGSDAVQQGTRSPGELFAFLLYAALLTRPIGSLGDAYSAFQIARGTLARLEAVFAKAPEPGYAQTKLIEQTKGAITFEAVSFAYQGRAPVLTRASLAIRPGETIALTGENGSGKSTLISLLLRFYDPDSGRILIDGHDISQVQVQSLRRQFGYVPQRPLLLDGSVAENIAFGVPDPDPARIEQATRAALAWDFIAGLPRGLETRIGDDGVRLSGGQRQRIALARALYHDPAIYIFDEATSMFDLDAEAAFVESCARLLEGRTVILITHRPASLALADRVIHLGPEGLSEVTGRGETAASLWDGGDAV
jgi:ATP-binding cassette subfamily B protein/subfamily B ATP-binding cassette protein MsbA